MKKIQQIVMVLFCILVGMACSDDIDMSSLDKFAEEPVVPYGAEKGQLLIKFKPEVTPLLDTYLLQTKGRSKSARTSTGVEEVDAVLERIGAWGVERVFPVDNRHEERAREAGLHLWYVIHFAPEQDMAKLVKELRQLGKLSGCQFNHQIQRAYNAHSRPVVLSKVSSNPSPMIRSTRSISNDPLLSKQWGMVNNGDINLEHSVVGADINCTEAWEKHTGDPSIIVAVLDEGVMYNHEDLAANMWVNPGESDMTSQEDNDGNGYIGDKHGFNFVKRSGYLSWNMAFDTGHGTHVAGVVAAAGNNGIGIAGVAGGRTGAGDGVKIMSCQLFDGPYGVSVIQEAQAIKYAADNGAVVLQCSWGYNSGYANPLYYKPAFKNDDQWLDAFSLEKEALDYFIHNAGSPNGVIEGGIAVFAAGNEYAPMAGYPGAYKDYISVAAVAADYTPSAYTNYDRSVRISAPGGDFDYHRSYSGGILSTIPYISGAPMEDRYGYMEGTSMACPSVSGTVALGLSYAFQQRKHFKASEFRRMVLESAYEPTYPEEKIYYKDWIEGGDNHPIEMDLANYRGRMGGVVDAGKLLAAIDDEANGKPMRVPNMYLVLGSSRSMDLARFFKNGEGLTYEFSIVDTGIATSRLQGSVVTVEGLKEGIVVARVSATGHSPQDIYITVRKDAGAMWMGEDIIKLK